MKTSRLWLVFGALVAVCLVGCSTPESRIRQNPEAFARLTPAQQDMIKKGEVALGFDQEMVQLALGEPSRIYLRTDASGTSESWSYTTYETMDGMMLYRGWYHRYYSYGSPFYPYYLSYPSRREREHFRVVFKEGRVIEIQAEKR